jgi:DNA helicase-2/ATP-dependent DNA helicase PcrA
LSQLGSFHPEAVGSVLNSKAEILVPLARSLPPPHKFTPVADLASEIEWAKNQRITPDRYQRALGEHVPPIPADHMARIFTSYENQKSARNAMDFEDILAATIRMFDEDDTVAEGFRARIKAITVDEYQDVNLLQQSLLDLWLGNRDELCAVGDDYQAIYSFTGATPHYLLDMPARYPDAQVVKLERSYRSTPQVLDVANRLAPQLKGAKKILVTENASGPEPVLKGFFDSDRETRFIVEQVTELRADGVPYDEMAIFYRTNAKSEVYEDALGEASIPYQVRDGAFLERPAARRMLPALKRIGSLSVGAETLRFARAEGMRDEQPERAGQQEITRQKDLAQLVALAEEFEDGSRSTRDFVAFLEERFGRDAHGRGVNLLTLHSAKGLEFDTVFIPALEEGELPYKRATETAMPEERRLLYVGLTRAKRRLYVTWSIKKPSRFVAELKPPHDTSTKEPGQKRDRSDDGDLLTELKKWRLERARTDEVPAYVVLHDSTLEEIAERRPHDEQDLIAISGMGPTKCERYGPELLKICAPR